MSEKLHKEKAREKFRSSISIKDINAVDNLNPLYDYKHVICTYSEGLKRIDRYIDAGWEVVYSKDKLKDDRKNASAQDGTEEDLRTSPVTSSTRGGNTQILMKILKTKRSSNETSKAVRDKVRLDASRKRKVQQSGATQVISEDVDLSDE